MDLKIKILDYENSGSNTGVIESALILLNHYCEIKRVSNRNDYITAIMTELFDVILCDYSIEDLDAGSALKYAREITPKSVFIFIISQNENNSSRHSIETYSSALTPKITLSMLNPVISKAISDIELNYGYSFQWG